MSKFAVNFKGNTFFRWWGFFTREDVINEFDRAINLIDDPIEVDMLDGILTRCQRRQFIRQNRSAHVWNLTIKILKQWDSVTMSNVTMFDTYTGSFGRRYRIQMVDDRYYLMYKFAHKHADITDCRKLIKNYAKLIEDYKSQNPIP